MTYLFKNKLSYGTLKTLKPILWFPFQQQENQWDPNLKTICNLEDQWATLLMQKHDLGYPFQHGGWGCQWNWKVKHSACAWMPTNLTLIMMTRTRFVLWKQKSVWSRQNHPIVAEGMEGLEKQVTWVVGVSMHGIMFSIRIFKDEKWVLTSQEVTVVSWNLASLAAAPVFVCYQWWTFFMRNSVRPLHQLTMQTKNVEMQKCILWYPFQHGDSGCL